jgi:hypothetical protein
MAYASSSGSSEVGVSELEHGRSRGRRYSGGGSAEEEVDGVAVFRGAGFKALDRDGEGGRELRAEVCGEWDIMGRYGFVPPAFPGEEYGRWNWLGWGWVSLST